MKNSRIFFVKMRTIEIIGGKNEISLSCTSSNHFWRVCSSREIGADNTFLPGGYVEQGESAEKALIREIEEEIGYDARIISFLGAVEATCKKDEVLYSELNLIFNVRLSSAKYDKPVSSKESHLEFVWVKRSEIKHYNLLPEPMVNLVNTYLNKINAFWGTRIEN
ncbi:MAG: NUDIX domain-containing protein [Thermotogota bacterium]|nr:NUDIX domain-containing protein [Thermotogota bacterium]